MHLTTNQGILICVVVVAASSLMQAIMMIVIAIGAAKARKRVQTIADRVEEDMMPAIKTARGILEDASPKLKQAAYEMLEVSRVVRRQVDHMNETFTDIVDKTHIQANRVDEYLTVVMDGLGRAGDSVQRATGGTSRKMGAVLQGIRVGAAVLRARRPASR